MLMAAYVDDMALVRHVAAAIVRRACSMCTVTAKYVQHAPGSQCTCSGAHLGMAETLREMGQSHFSQAAACLARECLDDDREKATRQSRQGSIVRFS